MKKYPDRDKQRGRHARQTIETDERETDIQRQRDRHARQRVKIDEETDRDTDMQDRQLIETNERQTNRDRHARQTVETDEETDTQTRRLTDNWKPKDDQRGRDGERNVEVILTHFPPNTTVHLYRCSLQENIGPPWWILNWTEEKTRNTNTNDLIMTEIQTKLFPAASITYWSSHVALSRARLNWDQTPSTGLRHPSFNHCRI